jgi:hypothetical protein
MIRTKDEMNGKVGESQSLLRSYDEKRWTIGGSSSLAHFLGGEARRPEVQRRAARLAQQAARARIREEGGEQVLVQQPPARCRPAAAAAASRERSPPPTASAKRAGVQPPALVSSLLENWRSGSGSCLSASRGASKHATRSPAFAAAADGGGGRRPAAGGRRRAGAFGPYGAVFGPFNFAARSDRPFVPLFCDRRNCQTKPQIHSIAPVGM